MTFFFFSLSLYNANEWGRSTCWNIFLAMPLNDEKKKQKRTTNEIFHNIFMEKRKTCSNFKAFWSISVWWKFSDQQRWSYNGWRRFGSEFKTFFEPETVEKSKWTLFESQNDWTRMLAVFLNFCCWWTLPEKFMNDVTIYLLRFSTFLK